MEFKYLRSCVSINSLNAFADKNFKYSWSISHLQDHIKHTDSFNLFCYSNDDLVGYILFNLNPFTLQAHLYQLCVDPEYREMKFATKMFKQSISMMEKVDSVYLEVEVSNHVAISFYEKLGFEQLNKVYSFYSDGSDAYAMHLNSSKLAKLRRY